VPPFLTLRRLPAPATVVGAPLPLSAADGAELLPRYRAALLASPPALALPCVLAVDGAGDEPGAGAAAALSVAFAPVRGAAVQAPLTVAVVGPGAFASRLPWSIG
jgi:hypothetical protein